MVINGYQGLSKVRNGYQSDINVYQRVSKINNGY